METILSVFAGVLPTSDRRRRRRFLEKTRPGLVNDDARTVRDNAP